MLRPWSHPDWEKSLQEAEEEGDSDMLDDLDAMFEESEDDEKMPEEN